MVQNWKLSVSLPPNLKRYLMLPWVVPHNCSLGSFRHYDAPDRCSTWFARMMKLCMSFEAFCHTGGFQF
ncbi:hypothetical protein COP2_011109 [Malus domestica]